MKEELIQQATEIVKLGKEGIVAIVEYTKVQFPELTKEIILWGIVENAVETVIILLVLSVCVFVEITCIKKMLNNPKFNLEMNPKDIFLLLTTIVSFLIGFIFLIFLFPSIAELLKVIIAPRLYLIDYFKEIIK